MKKIIIKLFYVLTSWVLSLKIFYSVEKLYRPMTTIQASQRQFEDTYESYRHIMYNSMTWNGIITVIIIVNVLISLLIFRKEIKNILQKKEK